MKILIATGIFPPDVGGPAGYVERIVPEFLKLGHKVRVITYSDQITNYQLPITNYFVYRVLRKKSKLLTYLGYFFKVLKYAKGADIIYLQDSVSAGLPTTLANLILKKKLVLKIVGDYAWEMGGNKVKPTLDEFYPFDETEYNPKINLLKKFQTWVAKKADKIIAPSNYLKKIVRDGWGVKSGKIHVVYNSCVIPDKTPVIPAQAGIYRNGNLMVSVGRLVPWKGFDTLIELMSELPPELRLEIIGGGPEKENLKALIKVKNLENRVKLVGKLPHDELIKKLKSVGMFVLNTRYEGLSHVLIEALVCGTPVITTNVGGNPEVIKNYENGYLVNHNDKDALKTAILKIRQGKNLQEQFRQNGYKSLEKFNFNEMIEGTLKILKEDLRVLMVSTDKTILDSQSVSAGRMRDYGTICDELHILVCKTGKARVEISKNVWAYSVFGLNKILKLAKYNVITTQDPFKTGIIGYVFSKILNTKLNIQLHGDFYGSDYWKGFLREIGKFIIKRADSVRVVSQRVKKSLVNFKIPEEKIVVAPIFTDIEKIENQLPQFNLHQKYPNKNPILLAVGRLEKDKNYPFLFNVFKIVLKTLPIALLVVVGDGSQRDYLGNLATQMEIKDKIIFEGWQDDLISYYKTADVYLLTSDYEGWGRSVIESRVAKCPVVMRNVGVAGEIVKSGEDGMVCDDEQSFASAIINLNSSPELRQKIIETAEKNLSKLHTKENILNLIKSSWRLVRL